MRIRPNYDEYFLSIAEVISTRSLDPNTRHGAVIVEDNKIISTGYNSWCKGLNDKAWNFERPEKYSGPLIHAELNAILNLVRPVTNATLYVTGHCCFQCLLAAHQIGIKRIVMYNMHGTEQKQSPHLTQFLMETNMQIDKVDRQLTAREIALAKGVEFSSSEEKLILMREAEDVSARLKGKGIVTCGFGSNNGIIQVVL